jgi:hypothetical protein
MSAQASPDIGKQPPPVEGDIDDYPFCTDDGGNGGDTGALIDDGSMPLRPEGIDWGQEAPHTALAASPAVC